MTLSPRRLLIVLVTLAVVVGAVVGYRWLTRTDTVDGTATAPGSAVILIPGYGGGTSGLSALASRLSGTGREVVIADIDDGHGDLRAYGAEVAALAASLKGGGATAVDLVGYSAGGLIARAAVASNPTAFARVATIGSPHHGTAAAGLGAFLGNDANCPTSCQQMAPDSEFLAALPGPGDATRWLSAWSSADDVIQPADSSVLDGATNVDVATACGAGALDHGEVVRSDVTGEVVVTFLATGGLPDTCAG